MRNINEIDHLLAEAEESLAMLKDRQDELIRQIVQLREEKASLTSGEPAARPPEEQPSVTSQSSQEARIELFRSLFRGREDVYALRFENLKTGKTGYSPASRYPRAPKIEDREFLLLTNEVVRNHLQGVDPHDRLRREFVVGIFPMLRDETCWFLAADFDKATWTDDTQAFLETCQHFKVPAALERSRSGNGGHIWIFFAEPIPAATARRMGSFLLAQTLQRRPEIGLDSYDRFFPNQDTLPSGGLGNLIALPLQHKPRASGNTLFLDQNYSPYQDQWLFLSSVRRLSLTEVSAIVLEADKQGDVGEVRSPIAEDEDQPWASFPSGPRKVSPIVGPVPPHIDMVLSNQIYVPKADLTPSLRNRLINLAAFQNPEFYKAQAMRLSTFGKPRIIGCSEDYPKHLALPRGCLDEVLDLFRSLRVEVELVDERFAGTPLDLQFKGALGADQQQAADALLREDTGVLSASTAFGKTVVAMYMIAQRNINTLVVVHRRQLLDQWVEAVGRFLGISPKDVGQIGGGKHNPTEKIDVAMVQSLCRKGSVDDIVAKYGHVVVDECHHIPAVTFEQVVRQSKAKYVTGLSATVVRKDGHHPIILMQCGPVRYRVLDRKQAQKQPFDHKAIIRPTSFRLLSYLQNAASPPIQEIYALLAQDEDRNRLIVQDVIAAMQAKRCPVLLTERREHLDALATLLSQHVRNVFVMTGGMGKKQRRKVAEQISDLPSDEPRLILATGRYLGEGFDDDRLDTLFLALPISWRGTLTQYAGRLHRLNAAKKDVIIYDYTDFDVPVLAKMYAKRRAGYKAIGYAVSVSEKEVRPAQLPLEEL